MKLFNNNKRLYLFNKIIFSISFVMLFGVSCNNNSSDISIIKGKIQNAQNKTLQIEEIYPGFIDTVAKTKISKKGEFKIKIKINENTFHRLKLDDNNIILLKINPNEKIEINANYPGIARNYKISGSTENLKLKELTSRLFSSADELNLIQQRIMDSAKIIGYNIDSLIEVNNIKARELYKNDKEFLTEFIKSNHKLSIIYIALYQYIGVSPILTIENDLEIFEYVLEELKKNNPDLKQIPILEAEINKYKLSVQNKTRNYINLKIGDTIPDFALPDINDKIFTLYSIKNKKIMLVFWSSWSKASLDLLSNLKDISINHPDINIILISLDNNKKQWISTINNYVLNDFINLCDLKAWESPIVFMYSVKKLPFVICIDENKRIQSLSNDPKINLCEK